jgi:hypothetical protein
MTASIQPDTTAANVPLLTPHAAAAPTIPADPHARNGLEAAALTLLARGMAATAEQLCEQLAADGGPDARMWQARAQLARETWRADALMRDVVAPGFVPIPSALRNPDGSPRFVLQVAASHLGTPDGVNHFTTEIDGGGVSAELRHFLDQSLVGDAVFIDWAGGEGYAAMSALTTPAANGRVIVRTTGDLRAGIERSAAQAEAADRLTIVDAADDAQTLDGIIDGLAAPVVHVHAGSADEVPALMAGARASVHAGRVASVCWQVPADGAAMGIAEQVAGSVLSVLGFQHFVVVEGREGPELGVFDGTLRGQSLVVSLSPGYLASQGGEVGA